MVRARGGGVSRARNKLSGEARACHDSSVRRLPLLAAILALSCAEPAQKPKSAAADGASAAPSSTLPPPAETPVEVVPAQRPSQQAGALENTRALRRFYERLAQLESGQLDDDVRVAHFGDSHTAADLETAVIRRALQERFGDGGRGFVALGQPWKRYLQDGVKAGNSREWARERARGKNQGDGCYGLGGVCLIANRRGARAWTEVAAKTSRAEVAYLEQPGGGAFEVLVDGQPVVRIATRADRVASAFRAFGLPEASAHQIEIRTVGDGDVRVYGVALEREQRGLVYDALGINGARATITLAWNEAHWAEQLRHRAPGLVVLAYGTNESGDDTSEQRYERQLVDVLGRIARAVPTASCLLVGPPDRAIEVDGQWMTSPKIEEIVATQRRVAHAAGCAFYDQMTAMGGRGSMAAWALEEPPRAQKDRVHLTREGYAQLGSAFVADLLRGYAAYRRETGLAPSAASAPQGAAAAP